MSKLPVIKKPTTKFTAPSGKSYSMRAYDGAEEKMIMSSKMSQDPNDRFRVMAQVISQITATPKDEISSLDFEFLMLKMYELSVDENLKVSIRCSNKECDHVTPIVVPLEHVQIREVDTNETTIDVGEDEAGNRIVLQLRKPTIDDILVSIDSQMPDATLLLKCMIGLFVGKDDLSDESFTAEELAAWFNSTKGLLATCMRAVRTDPVVSYTSPAPCVCSKCGTQQDIHLKGFSDFFR